MQRKKYNPPGQKRSSGERLGRVDFHRRWLLRTDDTSRALANPEAARPARMA
jgi:hypothetical protein